MIKLKLIPALMFISIGAIGQINIYKPYRTNGNVQVVDSALYSPVLKIASYPNFSLNGYANTVGQRFGLNTVTRSLNVGNGITFYRYLDSISVATLLAGKVSNYTSQAQRSFFSAPISSSGVPSFRLIDRLDVRQIFGANVSTGTLDWNDVSNTQPGSTPVLLAGTATNGMGGTTLYHPFNFEYSTKSGTGNLTQLAIPYNPAASDGIQYRARVSSTFGAWRKIYDTSNLNISLYAPLASPTLTGTPTVPTAATGTNTTQAASTAFVQQEILADRVVNTTTTALTTSDLNTTYPNVKVGFRVICHLITGAPAIYTKATEAGTSDVWLTTSATVTP